ncbi:MAG: PAS domain S-box protein [Chloroflexi bacterium]|nr:PAS domain S-box protein [Chloroflexota bacterium]
MAASERVHYLSKTLGRMLDYSLGRQVMTLLGLALLLVLIGFTASATYFVHVTEEIAWQGRQGEAARNAAGTMAAVISRARDTLGIVALLNADELKSNREELAHLLEQNPTLEEVVRLDGNGQMFVNAHRHRAVLAELITIPQSRWFLDARSGRPYLGPVQLSFNEQPYVLMAIPTADGGVAAARVQINVLWQSVADIRFGVSGRAYVVAREGDIVAHTNTEVVLAGINIAGRPELQALLAAPNAEWHGEYTNFQGIRVVGATAPVPNTGWIAITELPETEAFAASRVALLMLGGGLLIFMAVTMLSVARLVERLVVAPMGQLRDGAIRIGQGDLNHRIRLIRQDEIGQLAQAFDEMAGHLDERNRQVAAQTAALVISEARYRAIVEDQTELICRFKPDNTLTFVNEAYCRYFGRTREALLGNSFVPLIPAEDQPMVIAHMASLGPQNPVTEMEHRVVRSDGAVRWQHWTDRAILDAVEGQIEEIQAVGQDITERRAAETALRASEASLRRITDNMFDVISQIDTAGVIQYASPSHKWILGIEPEEAIGQFIFERLHPDDMTGALEAFAEALNSGDTRKTVTFRYRHADGHYVWLEAAGNMIVDSQGVMSSVILSSRDITARRQMESALRESENLYRLLAENATDLIWMRDMNLRLTYISPSVYKLRGVTAEAALTQGLTEILTPESTEAALNFFASMLVAAQSALPDNLRSQSRRLESELLRQDGSTVWTESVMTFLLDEQGQPSQIQGVTRDISERRHAAEELRRLNLELEDRVLQRTADLMRVNEELTAEVAERQRAEAALRESEARLRRVTDNMLDMIAQTDEQGCYVYVSPSHKPILGYEPQELLGRPILETIHPDDAALAYATATTAFNAAAPARMELRFRHASGRYIWLESVGNPLFDDQGHVVGSIIGSRDVTARKAAEAQLVQLRQAVDNSSEAIFMTDREGVIIFMNPAFTRLYGYPAAEIINQATPRILKSEVQGQSTYEDLWQTILSKKVVVGEMVNRAKDGRLLTIESTVNPIVDERQVITGFLAIQRDISQRKQTEEQIKTSLREKEVLLKEIHHRVKNNLQIISSLLHLQSNTTRDPQTLELLRDSQNRVRSMALVHEKLYRSPDLAQISLAEYAQSLAAQLFRTYSTAAGAVVLQVKVEDIWLDAEAAVPCGLIINELVSNALKHAFPDGREGEIGLIVRNGTGDRIVMQISDTGVGFPPGFDFRTSPSLGLKLVNTLVDQLGGTLELERGAGTIFQIEFTNPARYG